MCSPIWSKLVPTKVPRLRRPLRFCFFNWFKLSASQLVTPLCLLLRPSVELLRRWLFDWRVKYVWGALTLTPKNYVELKFGHSLFQRCTLNISKQHSNVERETSHLTLGTVVRQNSPSSPVCRMFLGRLGRDWDSTFNNDWRLSARDALRFAPWPFRLFLR